MLTMWLWRSTPPITKEYVMYGTSGFMDNVMLTFNRAYTNNI